jgi:GNAT superfamily N-acetyltransferase
MFCDCNLSRRLERAEAVASARFVEARGRYFPESGAQWIEVAGTFAMFDGVASPITQTFGLGLFEKVAEREMETLEEFFRSQGADTFHEVSPLAGAEMLALLTGRGYQPVELTSVMFRELLGGEPPDTRLNERIRARRIKDGEEELWAQIGARGWSTEAPELVEYLLESGRVLTGREGAECFLAELDGNAIAAGTLSVSGGVALLGGACTVPEARGKGAQLALLDARLQRGLEQGCDLAMMCAAPGSASQRNAERHGFRVAYTRIKWRLKSAGS